MFDDLKDMARHLKVYLFGKGILTLGVFATAGIAAALGFSILAPAAVMCFGGIALTIAHRFYTQKLYEEDMTNLYRDNIASQLGIQPSQVSRAHLKEAAEDNQVIAQALKRQHQRTWLSIGTATLSGLVSLGLIVGLDLGSTLHVIAQEKFSDMLQPLARLVGIGTVSGISGLLLQEGLGSAIGYGSGISKAAAHDLVAKMDNDVRHGIPIAREDVYAIVVAANPTLDKAIDQQYGKYYSAMKPAQKAKVLHDVHLAEAMDKIAIAINNQQIRPGYMAYAANDARLSILPVITTDTAVVRDTAIAHDPAPSNFVERLGLAPLAAAATHTDRIAQKRAQESPAAQLG